MNNPHQLYHGRAAAIFYMQKAFVYSMRRLFDAYIACCAGQFERTELRHVLRYCSSRIDSYRGRGSSLKGYDRIDKHFVRKEFSRIQRKTLIKTKGYTSGTTGTPAHYYRDIRSIAAEQYFQSIYFGWNGMYKVVLRGAEVFRPSDTPKLIYRNLPLIREMYISSYHLNEKTAEPVVKKLMTIENKVLWAYPATASRLADICYRNGWQLKFDLVALSSEQLMPHQVRLIEKVFGCPVRDWYGQAERVGALCRCEYGHYHEVPRYAHHEFIHRQGNLYEVVGTTLHNRVMPLIRYSTGDIVEISDKPCPCGNPGRNIVRIHGRINDYVELPNGNVFGTVVQTIFDNFSNIREAQVIQRRDKRVVVKIVREKEFTSQDEDIIRKWLGEYIPVSACHIEYVESIEKDGNGKFRFIINENARQEVARQG